MRWSLVRSAEVTVPDRDLKYVIKLPTNIVTRSPSSVGSSINASCALICSHFVTQSYIACQLYHVCAREEFTTALLRVIFVLYC